MGIPRNRLTAKTLKMVDDQLAEQGDSLPPPRHKYGVAPKSERYSKALNRTFHSKGERLYAEHLYVKQVSGMIRNLEFQKRVILRDRVLSIVMIVDFYYFDERRGEWIYDEYKGMETNAFKRQKKAWALIGPGLYVITKKGTAYNPWPQTEIRPKGDLNGKCTGG